MAFNKLKYRQRVRNENFAEKYREARRKRHAEHDQAAKALEEMKNLIDSVCVGSVEANG